MPIAPRQGSRVRAGQSDIRRNNLAVVMESLLHTQPNSRTQIAAETGLTRATVSALIGELVSARLVAELAKERDGQRGRPATPLAISGQRFAAIGAEINADLVMANLMDLSGIVRSQRLVEASRARGPKRIITQLVTIVNGLLAEAKEAGLEVTGVG